MSKCQSMRVGSCVLTFYSSRALGRLIKLAPMLREMSRNFESFHTDTDDCPRVSSHDEPKRVKDLPGRRKGSASGVAVSLKGLL